MLCGRIKAKKELHNSYLYCLVYIVHICKRLPELSAMLCFLKCIYVLDITNFY